MPRIVCLDTNVVIWGLLADGKAEDDIKRYKAQYLLNGVNVLYTEDDNLLKLASEFIQAQRLPTPPPQQLELEI